MLFELGIGRRCGRPAPNGDVLIYSLIRKRSGISGIPLLLSMLIVTGGPGFRLRTFPPVGHPFLLLCSSRCLFARLTVRLRMKQVLGTAKRHHERR